jgi:hypothetical protein
VVDHEVMSFMADQQVLPTDLFHYNLTSHHKRDCAHPLHEKRRTTKIKDICAEITPGLFCGNCNAETFVIAAYLLFQKGFFGPPGEERITSANLLRDARAFLRSTERTSILKFFVVFASKQWATDDVVGGCHYQAWTMLSRAEHFDNLLTWMPTVRTKSGKSFSFPSLLNTIDTDSQAEPLAFLQGLALDRQGGHDPSQGP